MTDQFSTVSIGNMRDLSLCLDSAENIEISRVDRRCHVLSETHFGEQRNILGRETYLCGRANVAGKTYLFGATDSGSYLGKLKIVYNVRI